MFEWRLETNVLLLHRRFDMSIARPSPQFFVIEIPNLIDVSVEKHSNFGLDLLLRSCPSSGYRNPGQSSCCVCSGSGPLSDRDRGTRPKLVNYI